MHARHKIIITGTGRAGTTFLVRLLTALGQPTGYDRESWREDYFPHCAAGLEHDLADPRSPYIVKNPELCVTLPALITRGDIAIDHAIIPVRDLASAARSRIRIGGGNGNVPGGLIGTDSPPEQQTVLAERFHELVHTLVAHDIPHTFLLFPRFVEDAHYAFSKLHPIFPTTTWPEFESAFGQIADPSLVHSFGAGRAIPNSATATFCQRESRKRRIRRVRRVGGWMAFATATLAALAFRAPTATESHPDHHHGAAILPSTRSVIAEDRSLHSQSAGNPGDCAPRPAASSLAERGPTPILFSELTEEPILRCKAADLKLAFLVANSAP